MAQQRMQLMPAVLETFAKQNLPGCADCTYLRLVRNMSRWFAKVSFCSTYTALRSRHIAAILATDYVTVVHPQTRS